MTINQLMTLVDDLTPNQYTAAHKLRWLNEVEKTAFDEILSTHEGDRPETFTPYAAADDTELLILDPYSRIYPLYLEMRIHYHNAETARYNNAAAAFQAAWEELRNWYNRTHAPVAAAARLHLMGGGTCA